MSQKETTEKETSYLSDVFVDVLWDSYAGMMSFARKSADASEEVFVSAWGDSSKWMEEERKEFVKTQRERTSAFWGLHDDFVSMVKENQRTLFREVEDKVRPFVRA
jgi:hypothetical protein